MEKRAFVKAVVSRAVRLRVTIKRASTVYQTLETAFHHNLKLLEVCQLCSLFSFVISDRKQPDFNV